MSEMKSAWEKAMEKVEKLGKPSTEELMRIEHIPAGNTLAARYLQEEQFDLEAELNKYKDMEIRQYIVRGAQEIFLRNITLPRNEQAKQALARAMAGIKVLKQKKKQLDAIYELINNLVSYYEQALQQTFAQFKKNFEIKLQEKSINLQQRQATGQSIEAELQQQFQDEWRRVSTELDSKYEKTLEEHKQQILKVA